MKPVIASRVSPRSNPAAAHAEPAGLLRRLRLLAMTVFASRLITACASPEASRIRGGGPGADVMNWGQPVEMHAGAEPFHDTPCVTEPVECSGPLPVFGPTPPPD
jgi:hypothetical protein